MTHSRPSESDVPPGTVVPWLRSRFHCLSPVVDGDASVRIEVVTRVSGTTPATPAPDVDVVDVHDDSLMWRRRADGDGSKMVVIVVGDGDLPSQSISPEAQVLGCPILVPLLVALSERLVFAPFVG